MHRWDFDCMAIALQQGSVERASFLKELDKNMMEQSEQMEKALSAPAADETWKLSIQAIVETGKKFFAHTKALHTTKETRRANQERWALLRRRQVIRQQLEATAAKGIIHAQQPWTAFHFRIRELGRRRRAALRRSQAQAEENMLAELQEAANRERRPRSTDFASSWHGTRSERQTLCSRGSSISLVGRVKKVVRVISGGGRDACNDSQRL